MADKHWGGGEDLRDQVRNHEMRLDKLEKEGVKSLKAAIADVAAAIREGNASADGALQAKIDSLTAQVEAHNKALADATKK